LVAVTLIAELTLVIFAIFKFNEYFIWLESLSLIIAFIVVLHILGKKQNAEFKVPWLVVILVLPFVGLTWYLMFANPQIGKYHKKNMRKIKTNCDKYIQKGNDVEVENFLGDNYGLESYLKKNSYMSGSVNSRAKFYPDGKTYFEDLIADLEKAEKYIFLEYFTIDNGFIWYTIHSILKRKVKEGVEVCLIYDDMGTVSKLPGAYWKKLRKEGINAIKFNPFKVILTSIYNNRDHRKIVVVDGRVAYTGGINIADEYANIINPFGMWKDTGIKIEGEQVNNFITMFLQLFDMKNRKIGDYGKYIIENHPKFDDGYCNVFGCGPWPYYKEKVGEGTLINLINSAKKRVFITTPYLIVDYSMMLALKNAAFRGVDVRIICPTIPDKKAIFNMSRSNYRPLMESGVKIYEYTPGFIHAKQMLVDDDLAIVGTINLDFRSLVHHYEDGVLLYKNSCINDIEKDFIESLRVSKERTLENFKMSKIAVLKNALLSLITSML